MTQTLEKWTFISSAETGGIALTRYEDARWNEITQYLGAMVVPEFSETPIWDEMISKYPRLDLYSRPIATLANRRDYTREHSGFDLDDERDYSEIVDIGTIERVLAGLKRL